jgi:hypothetical protein
MPHPHINTNSSNNKCCKMSSSRPRGAGVGRVMFLGNPRSTLDNKYVSGSGIGATTTAIRRALQRRATENGACCDNKIADNDENIIRDNDENISFKGMIVNYLDPTIPTQHISITDGSVYYAYVIDISESSFNIMTGTDVSALAWNTPDSIFSGIELPASHEGGTFHSNDYIINADLPYVYEIQQYALKQCTNLISVNMPLVKTMEKDIFYNCINLQSIKLNHLCNTTNVESWGRRTFSQTPYSGTLTLIGNYDNYSEASGHNSVGISDLVGNTNEGDIISNSNVSIEDLSGWTLQYEKIT